MMTFILNEIKELSQIPSSETVPYQYEKKNTYLHVCLSYLQLTVYVKILLREHLKRNRVQVKFLYWETLQQV